MSRQSGTPTLIRHAKVRELVSVVITVSTATAFTAHHHIYQVGLNGNRTLLKHSMGSWSSEKGACDSHEEWVEAQGGYIE